jgi:hypothetical protein
MREVVTRNGRHYQCEQGFPQQPPPMIQVSLGVNITAHGRIRSATGLSNGAYARVDQPAFASQPFERCIEQALQQLRFAPPKDNEAGFFAQKIVLEPGSALHSRRLTAHRSTRAFEEVAQRVRLGAR